MPRKPTTLSFSTGNDLADKILREVDEACRMFGNYTFGDKGAQEVMDLDAVVDWLGVLPGEDAAEVLCLVLSCQDREDYPNGNVLEVLVSDVLVALQESPDDFWNALMARDELAELF